MLPAKLQRLIDSSDEVLFTEGACHILADVLCGELGQHGFSLCRVEAASADALPIPKPPKGFMRGLHIYLLKDGLAVDIRGPRLESDLLSEWETKRGKVLRKNVERDDLFRPEKDDGENGPLNQWRHFLHEEFVELSRARARGCVPKLINQTLQIQ